MQESKTCRNFPNKDPEEWKAFNSFLEPVSGRNAKVEKMNVTTLVSWFHEFQMTTLLDECDNVITDTTSIPCEHRHYSKKDHQNLLSLSHSLWRHVQTCKIEPKRQAHNQANAK